MICMLKVYILPANLGLVVLVKRLQISQFKVQKSESVLHHVYVCLCVLLHDQVQRSRYNRRFVTYCYRFLLSSMLC